MVNSVVIALGSNLSDKFANLQKAIFALKNICEIIRISSIYSSDAVLKENSPSEWDIEFYNLVFLAETKLNPQQFLAATQQIEIEVSEGRREKNNWSPRVIDIDIIDWNNEIIINDNLNIPHKLMNERDFVLLPLMEIQPQYEHPINGFLVKQMLKAAKPNNLKKLELKLAE